MSFIVTPGKSIIRLKVVFDRDMPHKYTGIYTIPITQTLLIFFSNIWIKENFLYNCIKCTIKTQENVRRSWSTRALVK